MYILILIHVCKFGFLNSLNIVLKYVHACVHRFVCMLVCVCVFFAGWLNEKRIINFDDMHVHVIVVNYALFIMHGCQLLTTTCTWNM